MARSKKTYDDGYVHVGDGNYWLPGAYFDHEQKIKDFEVRDDDVFVVSHPKTGTNWCQEMVWLIANDFDYESAEEPLAKRFPDFEVAVFPLDGIQKYPFDEHLANRRFIKTALPWPLLPEQIQNGTKTPKIITILRNPLDVCVSYYHHMHRLYPETKLEDFCGRFLEGKYPFGPFWNSILSIWGERHRPNLLVLKYADMKKDLPNEIRKVANFLGKPIKDEQVSTMVNHLDIDAMKKNPAFATRYCYVRQGKVGGYKSDLTQEQIDKFEEWMEKNLRGTDLTFE